LRVRERGDEKARREKVLGGQSSALAENPHSGAERLLAAERDRISSILSALPDSAWSADYATDRVLYVSPKTSEIYGRPANDFHMHAESWTDAIHPDDKPAVLEAWRQLRTGGDFDLEYRIVRPDGSVRWLNDRAQLVRGASGDPERIDRLARDITAQVEQRQRAARLSRIRELIGSINAALIRLRERDALFDELCRIAVALGGLRSARIALTNGTPDELAWVASAGTVPASDGADVGAARPLIARLLHMGVPAVWNDIRSDSDDQLKAVLLVQGARSIATFPLHVEGRSIGLLVLYSSEASFFDDEEVRLFREVTSNIGLALELLAKQDKLDYLALYDPLTGLPNRTLFRERLTQALDAERRGQSKLALMLFDLERFKAVNDAFGQLAGDRLLQQIAADLRSTAGDVSRVAHLGGDVFAIMIPALHDAENIATVLRERAARILNEPFTIEDRELRLQVKAGIALFPEDGADADTLFRNAEAALKRAKQTGERYLFYAPQINSRVAERLDLEHALRNAIEQRQFVLHFQPKVDLATRRIVGVEALVRWQRPGVGLVLPGPLIPVLEESGMILELGQWVIDEAVATHREWCARGLRAPRIAVNVSAIQLRQPDFTSRVRAAIEKGAQPCGLDLEVTETLLMEDMETAILKLATVRDLDIGVSLDDFGTGYSSLASLARLPVDTLKIDRAFIKGMTDHPDDTSIVTTIITLGHTLARKVIAEGVETEEQARLLRLLRCEQIQGNVFSPAVPRDRVELLIAAE
jgi:diguanylate cyclase (GGDEF)-like protein/PAS domain S-box-containing protein